MRLPGTRYQEPGLEEVRKLLGQCSLGALRGFVARPGPDAMEDYVDRSNPVRAIEAYVDALDVERLGFRHAGPSRVGVGQPPYDPADLLKPADLRQRIEGGDSIDGFGERAAPTQPRSRSASSRTS